MGNNLLQPLQGVDVLRASKAAWNTLSTSVMEMAKFLCVWGFLFFISLRRRRWWMRRKQIKRSCFRFKWNKTCVCVSYSFIRFHTFFRRFLTARKILRGKKKSLYRRTSWTSWSLIVRHVLSHSLSSGKIDWIDLKVWRSIRQAGASNGVIRRHFKVSNC